MIDGILISLCFVSAVFSRKLYYYYGRKLNDGYLAGAAILDVISSGSGFALLVLASYWNIIP